MRIRARRAVVGVFVLGLVAASCGSDGAGGGASPTATTATTVVGGPTSSAPTTAASSTSTTASATTVITTETTIAQPTTDPTSAAPNPDDTDHDDSDPDDTGPDDSTDVDTTVDPANAPVAEPDDLVQVSSRGSEPRRELRITATAGTTTRYLVRSLSSIGVVVDGAPVSTVPRPLTDVEMDVTIDDVAADGTISYSFVYVTASARATGTDPDVVALAEATHEQLQQLVGLSGSAVVTERGAVHSFELDTATIGSAEIGALLDSLSGQMGELSVPLPHQSVGKGATWSSTRDAKVAGIATSVTAAYRLVSVDDDVYVIDARVTMSAQPGPIELPGLLPQSTAATVVEVSLEGRGLSFVRPGEIIASAKVDLSGDMEFIATIDGEDVTVSQNVSSRTESSSLDP